MHRTDDASNESLSGWNAFEMQFMYEYFCDPLPILSLLFAWSQIRKRQSSGSMSEDKFAASAREYVESLHQNSRVHLLYGKNNVLVQPVRNSTR